MNIKELKKLTLLTKRKDSDRGKVLEMLVGRATSIAKTRDPLNPETTEEDIYTAANKLYKEAVESVNAGVKEAQIQLDVLEEYKPAVLSEDETKIFIQDVLKGIDKPNIGLVMKAVQKNNADKSKKAIDNKIASTLAKELMGV